MQTRGIVETSYVIKCLYPKLLVSLKLHSLGYRPQKKCEKFPHTFELLVSVFHSVSIFGSKQNFLPKYMTEFWNFKDIPRHDLFLKIQCKTLAVRHSPSSGAFRYKQFLLNLLCATSERQLWEWQEIFMRCTAWIFQFNNNFRLLLWM